MLDFLQMIASGIAVGSTYALMGIAMVIIYKTSEVPNFAQGEMALISSPGVSGGIDIFNFAGVFAGVCHPASRQRTQYSGNDRHYDRY
jgi:hypothetical protein